MLANINRALLITTSNRSEGDVGYATMDGDTAGSIAPIAGVDKHFIRQWLIWAEKEKGYHALHRVNQMAPTAELRPIERNQTDEKDLMPYDVLAQIERLFVKDKKSPQEIVNILTTINKNYSEGELKNFVEKFLRMFAINQWKRERIAPSFHLDDFNIDPRSWFRFPILNSTFGHEIKNIK
jgi:NAD+ synthase (glutamine-hydrolysing)